MYSIPKEIKSSFTMHEMHVAYWYITMHFQPPYLHKLICFLNRWKQGVKTIVR